VDYFAFHFPGRISLAGIFGLFGRVSRGAQSDSLAGRDRSLPIAATRKVDSTGRTIVARVELITRGHFHLMVLILGGGAVGTSINRFSEHPRDARGQIRTG